MEHLPEEIYLTKVGDTTFLVIEDGHMWPVSGIKHIDMQLNSPNILVQFDGNQSWTFKGDSAEKFRRILNTNRLQEQSLSDRMV